MIEIHSPLPPAECLRQIEATFNAQFDSILSLPRGRVLGRIDGDTFNLIYMGYAGTSSLPWAARSGGPAWAFSGRVVADGTGSIVVGDWDRSLPQVLYGLLYVVACLGLLVTGVYALINYQRDPTAVIAPLAVVLMLGSIWLGFRGASAVQNVYARSAVEIVAKAVGAQMPDGGGRW